MKLPTPPRTHLTVTIYSATQIYMLTPRSHSPFKDNCYSSSLQPHTEIDGQVQYTGFLTSAFGPMKMSPSKAPAITRTCFGLPTLEQRQEYKSF